MSRYDHKIETSLEGIEHLSKENKEEIERKMKEKNNYSPKVRDSKLIGNGKKLDNAVWRKISWEEAKNQENK